MTAGRYRGHLYKWSNPFGSPRHHWELRSPDGGLHFHVSLTPGYDPSCGLEIHRCTPAEYQRGEAPHHIDCPITGGRCWHDGTSLYASEFLWPLIEPYARTNDHERIFAILEREADERFGYSNAEQDNPPSPSGVGVE